MSGIIKLSEALKENTALQTLRYANSFYARFLLLSAPSDVDSTLVGSVRDNRVGPEGTKALGEALKVNQTLTSVEYAAARPISCRQRPLTALAFCAQFAAKRHRS